MVEVDGGRLMNMIGLKDFFVRLILKIVKFISNESGDSWWRVFPDSL